MRLEIMTDNGSAMWIAKKNLGAQVDQLIDKEHAAFDHCLLNQHTSVGLCTQHDHNTQYIWCKPRPRRIGNSEDGAVYIPLNFVFVLFGNMDVGSYAIERYSEFSKRLRNDSQVIPTDILYRNIALGHRCHPDPTSDFNHVGKDSMCTTF